MKREQVESEVLSSSNDSEEIELGEGALDELFHVVQLDDGRIKLIPRYGFSEKLTALSGRERITWH